MFPAWTFVIREMAAAGVGVRTQAQVLRMDTDRPGNGQCAGPLRQKGGTLVDPGPKQPENSSWKALGCFSEGTVHLVVPRLRFIIRISWWHFFFFLHKRWAHLWKCPECEGMPKHLQTRSLYALGCTGRVRRTTKKNTKAYSWTRDADSDSVGSRAVVVLSPSSNTTHSVPGSAPPTTTAHTYLT